MTLKKTKKRLSELYEAVKAKGGADISAKHVRQILDKIDRKERKVLNTMETATDSADQDKLHRKLAVIDEQRKRGEELLGLLRSAMN